MPDTAFDLFAAARQEMIDEGFDPDFPPGTDQQLAALKAQAAPAADGDVRDLRALLWSSIDNDTSRDLDQIEVAERVNGGIRVRIAIADVDSDVAIGSPIDQHAAAQTTTVYTGIRTFPMLPEQLSTDLTSLNEAADRLAMVVDMVVAGDGSISSTGIYRALVRNQAQLTYNGVGGWLEGDGRRAAQGRRFRRSGGAVETAGRGGADPPRRATPVGRVEHRPRRGRGGHSRRPRAGHRYPPEESRDRAD